MENMIKNCCKQPKWTSNLLVSNKNLETKGLHSLNAKPNITKTTNQDNKHKHDVFYLDNSIEILLAKEEIVVGDTPLLPPKYHFFIISTTFAFSTSISESSLPSIANDIC